MALSFRDCVILGPDVSLIIVQTMLQSNALFGNDIVKSRESVRLKVSDAWNVIRHMQASAAVLQTVLKGKIRNIPKASFGSKRWPRTTLPRSCQIQRSQLTGLESIVGEWRESWLTLTTQNIAIGTNLAVALSIITVEKSRHLSIEETFCTDRWDAIWLDGADEGEALIKASLNTVQKNSLRSYIQLSHIAGNGLDWSSL